MPGIITALIEYGAKDVDKFRGKSEEELEEEARFKQERILQGTDQVIPKSEEWNYQDPVDRIQKLPAGHVSIKELNNSLKAPEVHLENCPEECKQKKICIIFRETKVIIGHIMTEVGDKKPIFRKANFKVVGSICEGSRLFYADEIDAFTMMNENYAEHLHFDVPTQSVQVSGNVSELKEYTYVSPVRTLDTFKLYQDFVETAHKVANDMDVGQLPDSSCSYSRTHLKLVKEFVPCLQCKDIKHGEVVFVRCQHEKEKSPCLTLSKVLWCAECFSIVQLLNSILKMLARGDDVKGKGIWTGLKSPSGLTELLAVHMLY